MHFNKAHAALLIASAGALTGGTQKKPFPKLRPLKSALAAKPDLFGINEEDALLKSKREGQDSFRGAFEKAALLQADVFGAFRRQSRLPSSNPLSATSELTGRLAQVSRTKLESSRTRRRAPASRTTCPSSKAPWDSPIPSRGMMEPARSTTPLRT